MINPKTGTILTVPQAKRRVTLSQYTKRTLGSGNLRQAVCLPPSEDENEWVAANIVDFFNEISLLFGLCHEDSQRFTKPGEGFPSGFEYRWADGVRIVKPIRCSSTQYVDFVMSWVESQLNDEKVFPVQETHGFPKDFKARYGRNIFRRLFRIFAIIFWSHFQALEKIDAATHLNTVFKHFMYFSFQFNLLDEKEIKPLAKPVARLFKDYESADK